MDLHIRLFGRAESNSAPLSIGIVKEQHEYTKRPALASHVLNTTSGGYSRNAHRLDDERKYLLKRKRVLYLLPVLAFFAVAGIALWGPFIGRPQALSAQQADVINDVQPTVVPLAGSSDEKQAANYLETYKTAATSPRILTIDSLDIRGRVLAVGLDGRNQPQLPKNSYDAGWYNVSALPGKPGALVISGACSGSVAQGIFHRLGELKAGALIDVSRGDGAVFSYAVETVETVAVDSVDMAKVLSPINTASGAEGLNLIGCTGKYDVKTNDFAKRTIVYAVRI